MAELEKGCIVRCTQGGREGVVSGKTGGDRVFVKWLTDWRPPVVKYYMECVSVETIAIIEYNGDPGLAALQRKVMRDT